MLLLLISIFLSGLLVKVLCSFLAEILTDTCRFLKKQECFGLLVTEGYDLFCHMKVSLRFGTPKHRDTLKSSYLMILPIAMTDLTCRSLVSNTISAS